MPHNDITRWLEQVRASGLSDMEIQEKLKAKGWNNEQINQVLVSAYHKTNTSNNNKEKIYSPAEKFQKEKKEHDRLQHNNHFSITSFPRIIDLLKYSWDLYRNKIASLLTISLITALVVGAFLGIYSFIIGNFEILDSPSTSLLLFFIMIFFLIGALSITFIQISLILAIHHEGVSIRTILGNALKLILQMWWINILVGFFVIGASFLFGIPGIIFSIWFSLSIYVLVIENVRGMQALLKSKEYVRNYWWKVLWNNVVISIIIGIPIIIISFIFTSMGQDNIGMIVTNILALLAIPYIFCYNYAIYRSLSDIKGIDLPSPQKKGGLITTAIIGWLLLPIIITFILASIIFTVFG